MKKFVLIVLMTLLVFSSCKKNSGTEINYNPDVLSCKDYIRGEDAIYEVVDAFFKGVYDSLVNKNGYNFIDNCDVSYRPALNALLFGYGNEDRMCQDGKFRRGNFLASFSGDIFAESVTAHIQTDSLEVDDHLVEITMDIKNLGMNADNKYHFSLQVDTSRIALPDTTRINGVKIKTDLDMVWEVGSNTPTIHEDDKFTITGTESGISSDGYAFSLTITDPLENWLDCFWISAGMQDITVPSASIPTGQIDYIAEDGCFNEFFYYFNGNTFYDNIK